MIRPAHSQASTRPVGLSTANMSRICTARWSKICLSDLRTDRRVRCFQRSQRHFIIDPVDHPGTAGAGYFERVLVMPAAIRARQLHVDEARLGLELFD